MKTSSRVRAQTLPSIIVTDRDLPRLRRCVEEASSGRTADAAEALDAELARASVVAAGDVPKDVVTMNSRLVFENVHTQGRRAIMLVYPPDANTSEGRISVLAPIGSAVLGLRAGDEIDWALPGGRTARLRVVEVSFQPDAAGVPHS